MLGPVKSSSGLKLAPEYLLLLNFVSLKEVVHHCPRQ